MIFKPLSILIAFVFLVTLSSSAQQLLNPKELVVSEGFKNPIGFYNDQPTFSWKLPISKTVKSQSAYQIVVASNPKLLPNNPDLWNSKKQLSNQSVWINYGGTKLNSRQKVYWQVRYWNQDDEVSAYSEINSFELGLLKNSDWEAQWVGLDTAKDSIKGVRKFLMHRPQYLRKGFELSSEVVSARLYITAKGVFDVHLNGENVSDDVMPPGWTPYNKRIETLTYDVTKFIESGQNTLAVELATGWHAGRISRGTSVYNNFASPKILCQLEIELKDGSKQVIISDQSWRGTTNGPIRLASIYDGETYDANLEMPNWTTNNFNDKKWENVQVEALDEAIKLEPKRHKTVTHNITLNPVEILTKTDTSVVYNFKQNMLGVPLVNVPMKKGDTLKIRFSEMLAPDGSFYTANYRSALSTDYYVAAEDKTITWSPKFTFHGFQYLELSGFDASKVPSLDWVKGLVQYSNIETNGSFTSSHEKLNQLQSNITWGLRSNFFDIPTDCPQRDERLGWTGDAQVISPTSMFNLNAHAFWTAWLQSMRETQSEHNDGLVPFIIPDVLQNKRASSGWGDAAVIVPWDIYTVTGDKTVLEENYDMMKKWVAYHETQAKDYISHMNSFGDWLQPFPLISGKDGQKGDTSKELIGTAYFAHCAHLISKIAALLNKPDDATTYKQLYENVATAFEREFFDANGAIKNELGTQTGYLLAIYFNLLKEETKQKAQKHLLEEIKMADYHLRTGFLGTPILPKVLDDMGEINLMYEILFKETYPSWFYSINQGATTMWERWDSYSKTEGYNPGSMNSLNHYAYGAVGQWMYERIAGLAPLEPGYKKIRIAPMPNMPLKSASASTNSPYGKVSSSWEINNKLFSLDVVVPPNTSAEITIPSGNKIDLKVNGKTFKNNSNLKLINNNQTSILILATPGAYNFQTKL
ncbi:family 78 glycoside hydrolase catalytic domain [Siansivirga zeaxanthinifaciens]|uniref:alpha-L-rhamnosidase n=1 Tax=Siansivirga zeaxanthinifaciens CC-SAMT-1 TaxID=1454006 RepID=A0A0C5VZI7_9FLAO|nr:family 78 glycoside hydrolase catalytic domain [Siansivirga zeaxanthinifaciens]AJR04481.1 rhamnosidase [Siansivirga zeaxanthinifaciens CC-SAMT-1]